MKKILLIISGSIACYKSIEFIRHLRKNNYEVQVIMTSAATKFITPFFVSVISGNETYDDLFSTKELAISHIDLSRKNDLIIVMPATADFINKIANGYADDLASTVILASNKPLIIAPAMNEKMWLNHITISNIKKLQENGTTIIEPITDKLACGEEGLGKIADYHQIFDQVEKILSRTNILKGKKVIISGGATFESLDPVRFIGNYSSGKQAIYLAEAFALNGAEVHLVASNIHLPINLNAKQISRVHNTQEMYDAIIKNLTDCYCFIGAAAVADFIPATFSPNKIKKTHDQELTIKLVKNIDILHQIANHQLRPNIVVGFAAESENIIENAQKKLQQKNCNLIIANDIDSGKIFNNDQTDAFIIDKTGIIAKSNNKKSLADLLVEIIANNLINSK